ncbi:hypothetical protein RJ640_017540 [Escallonia rubra]|uniref:Uncharacterized protein n=1 Tax=Escallonia rubra TaxID=112253 RepID=A0AA88UEF5_9ASTE|nr:hypothetical protein RJ640_017540 [Escallonia rubra]
MEEKEPNIELCYKRGFGAHEQMKYSGRMVIVISFIEPLDPLVINLGLLSLWIENSGCFGEGRVVSLLNMKTMVDMFGRSFNWPYHAKQPRPPLFTSELAYPVQLQLFKHSVSHSCKLRFENNLAALASGIFRLGNFVNPSPLPFPQEHFESLIWKYECYLIDVVDETKVQDLGNCGIVNFIGLGCRNRYRHAAKGLSVPRPATPVSGQVFVQKELSGAVHLNRGGEPAAPWVLIRLPRSYDPVEARPLVHPQFHPG